MKITVKLSGSSSWTRQQVIKQYASLEQTISFDDEKVHGDIRHLENKYHPFLLCESVHGDIRHLESLCQT